MNKVESTDGMTPSQRIDNQIEELSDWRGTLLARLRALILQTTPEIAEEWKWNTAVWAYKGNMVAGGVFKNHVKLTFFKGAFLQDPDGLFNAGFDAKTMRAIDLNEGADIDESALQALVRAGIAYNVSGSKTKMQ